MSHACPACAYDVNYGCVGVFAIANAFVQVCALYTHVWTDPRSHRAGEYICTDLIMRRVVSIDRLCAGVGPHDRTTARPHSTINKAHACSSVGFDN